MVGFNNLNLDLNVFLKKNQTLNKSLTRQNNKQGKQNTKHNKQYEYVAESETRRVTQQHYDSSEDAGYASIGLSDGFGCANLSFPSRELQGISMPKRVLSRSLSSIIGASYAKLIPQRQPFDRHSDPIRTFSTKATAVRAVPLASSFPYLWVLQTTTTPQHN